MAKRKLKRIVKRTVKWARKRIRFTSSFLATFVRKPANLQFIARWVRSLRFNGTALSAHVPNLPYAAARYLERQLHPQAVVFEYGGGGSTLWLAKRVAKLTTVEHNRLWFARVEQELKASGVTNCTLLLHQPQDEEASPPSSEDDGYGSQKCCGTFRDYVKTIDGFPDNSFDLVLVDGRSRPACLHHAASKVLPGGLLVLDDVHRDRYHKAMHGLDAWPRRDFRGIRPFRSQLGYTTCWIKPHTMAGSTAKPLHA
jgi:predicted O-methyltransferase YrrM